MFSERLDKLIQSSLQDGILTDQEKAAIIKRAKAEGEDIDEVEIYIDSLLQKRQKELNNSAVIKRANTSSMDELKKLIDAAMADGIITSKEREVITRKAAALGMDAAEVEVYLDAEIQKAEQAADMVKRDKIGKVCPQCGKQVPPLTIKCECGYEFTSSKSVSSVQLLFEKIAEIQSTPMKNTDPDTDKYKEEKQDRYNRIRQTISLFPVPNTKEDIVEFLSLSASKSKQRGGILGTVKGRLKIAIPVGLISIIIVCIAMMALFADAGSAGSGLVMGLFYGVAAAYGVFYFCLKKGVDILEDNKTAEVWHDKFDQVLMKGRSMFQRQLDYYENMLNQ